MGAASYIGFLLASLQLAGCAGAFDPAGPVGACIVHRDADLLVRRERDFILLPAILDGRPVQMVLDTGAEVSTISPAVALSFGLVSDPLNGRVLLGVGGDVRTGSVLASRFAVGELPPQPQRFSVSPIDILPELSPPVAGLLGADLLGGRDLELDVPRSRAALYTLRGCPDFQPWPDPKGVALTRTQSGLGFVVVDFDGSAVRALLDTGARTSFMTRQLAESLGITDAMLADDPATVRVGISRSAIDVRQHRFERISLGPVTWRDVAVGVADVTLPGVDMLLGADLLSRQAIWISPARKMLWLR